MSDTRLRVLTALEVTKVLGKEEVGRELEDVGTIAELLDDMHEVDEGVESHEEEELHDRGFASPHTGLPCTVRQTG